MCVLVRRLARHGGVGIFRAFFVFQTFGANTTTNLERNELWYTVSIELMPSRKRRKNSLLSPFVVVLPGRETGFLSKTRFLAR
jgi:hypothetical protein